MDSDKFNDIISNIVLAFEKAGVKDETLKQSIDSLFELKYAIYIRDEINKLDYKMCHYCKHYEKPYCKSISGEFINEKETEIVGQSPVNGRIKFKVNPFWNCGHFKKI